MEHLPSGMWLSHWEVSATGVPCTEAGDVCADQAQGSPHHRAAPPPSASGTQARNPKGADLDYSLQEVLLSSCVALSELLDLSELGLLRLI